MSDIQLTGFELIEKIGEGGMGHVWKARQLSLDRIVAIKLLSSRHNKDPESIRQIIQEARIAAKLKHPGIVQVYDASEEKGTYYFVMEFVNGYNVGEWIKRKKILSVKDALVVVESVVAALDYAWRTAGLIHCDIKPENIMVDQDGTIKVADLGLSLTRDSDLSQPSDEVAGTPGYISPEQVQGAGALDCRTDIYSLGCCLYQMVTGRRPFKELPDHEAMEAQVTSQIPDPREIVPGIPAPVCCLIERMLVKDRAKRLKDWQAVLAELRRVEKGVMPSGPSPRKGESTMERKALPKAAVPEGGDNAAAQAALPQAPAGKEFPWLTVILLILAGVTLIVFVLSRLSPARQQVVEPVLPFKTVSPVPTPVAPVVQPNPAPPVKPAPKPVIKNDPRPKQDEGETLEYALDEIKRVADDYASDGAYGDGIQWLEHYSGRWSRETASNRLALAAEFRKKRDERGGDGNDWQAFTKSLAGVLLAGKYSAARQMVETAADDVAYQKHHEKLVAVGGVLGALGSLNDKLLASLEKDVGSIVKIKLSGGAFVGTILDVKDRKIACKTLDGSAQVYIRLEDLAMSERMARLSPLRLPEVALVGGVSAFAENRYDDALEFLEKTGPVLAPILTAAVREAMANKDKEALTDDPACEAFAKLMAQAGLETKQMDLKQWRKAIDECEMSPETARTVERAMDAYLMMHGQSAFAGTNGELVLALQKAVGLALEDDKDSRPSGERRGTEGRQRPAR